MAIEPPGLELSIKTAIEAIGKPASDAVEAALGTEGEAGEPPTPPANPLRALQGVAGAAMSMINMGSEVTDLGFAMATAAVPSIPLPAATLNSLYLGPPHGHAHPPSLVPPAPTPVPLPSLGPVLLGTCVKVLIGGVPAARAGDIAVAASCCGFVTGATILTGSSKVFIGGTRAARASDMATACMKDTSGPVRGLAKALEATNKATAMVGLVADAVEAGTAADPALAAAQGWGVAVDVAQMAADKAATAMSAALGSDPAVPPAPGCLVTPPVSHVVIGGFPMVNLPDPAQWAFGRAKNRLSKRRKKRQIQDGDTSAGCPSCPKS